MKNIVNNKKEKLRKGFTVIELLVAMSAFSILMTITSGTFLRALRTQRSIVALIAANGNAQLAIEQMSREIRTGSDFSVNGDALSFTNARNEDVTYYLSSGALKKKVGTTDLAVTAANVSIAGLSFKIFNKDSKDRPYPPRITLVMRVGATGFVGGDNPILVSLQTSVSSRVLSAAGG